MKIHLSGPPGSAGARIDTEHHVVITDAFVGPVFRTADGVCLSVFMRDDGYEFHCWHGDADPAEPLPAGAIMGSINLHGIEGPPMRSTAATGAVDAGPTRITVGLTQRTNRELDELVVETGLSKTDLVNRAISLLALVTRETSGGSELAFIEAPGRGGSIGGRRVHIL